MRECREFCRRDVKWASSLHFCAFLNPSSCWWCRIRCTSLCSFSPSLGFCQKQFLLRIVATSEGNWTESSPGMHWNPIMSCWGIFFSPFGSPYFRLIVTFQEQVGYHCCWIPLVWFYGTTKFVEQTGGQSWDSFNAMLCEFEAALGRFDPAVGNGGDGQLLLSVLTQKHRRCSRLRQGDQQVIGTHPSSSVYVEIALPCFYL